MSQYNLSPREIMTASPVIPVIAIEEAHKAIDLAHALINGGVKVLEITLRTSAAIEAIKQIAKNIPDAIVGAGTVLNIKDLHRVIDAGAKFAISPGSTEKLLSEALELDFPLLPGVATASEIMMGQDLGYNYFKLFPAMSAGGINALKSFSGPFPQAMFCPTGGISEQNFLDFLKLTNVLCIGGSWIAPDKLIKEGNFEEITRLASTAIELYKQSK
jgi:2-dehydro-3-deoxyphosphogluconate aldolase / (4S)-4-hydroxy-2-oxoglutarate aldolase